MWSAENMGPENYINQNCIKGVGQDKNKGIQGGMGVICVEIPSDPED
jgi:hypothetical protein